MSHINVDIIFYYLFIYRYIFELSNILQPAATWITALNATARRLPPLMLTDTPDKMDSVFETLPRSGNRCSQGHPKSISTVEIEEDIASSHSVKQALQQRRKDLWDAKTEALEELEHSL